MGRPRSNDPPLHLTRVRIIPCENVAEAFNSAIRRVLNARAALPVPARQPDSDHEQDDLAGEDTCPN